MRCQMHKHSVPNATNRCPSTAAYVMTSPPPTLAPLTVYVCVEHSDHLMMQGWYRVITMQYDDYEALET